MAPTITAHCRDGSSRVGPAHRFESYYSILPFGCDSAIVVALSDWYRVSTVKLNSFGGSYLGWNCDYLPWTLVHPKK